MLRRLAIVMLISFASTPASAALVHSLNFDEMERVSTGIHVVEVLSIEGAPLVGDAPVKTVAQVKCLRTLKGDDQQGKTLSIEYARESYRPSPNLVKGAAGMVFLKSNDGGPLKFADDVYGLQPAVAGAPNIPANASSRDKIEREFLAAVAVPGADDWPALHSLDMLLTLDSRILRTEGPTLQKAAKGFLAPSLERAMLALRLRDGDASALKEIKSLRPVENDPHGRTGAASNAMTAAIEKFSGKDGSAALCDLLDHADEHIRYSAAQALRKVADESAVPALLKHLVDESKNMSPEFLLSYNCMAALFRLSDNKHQPSVGLYQKKQKEYNDNLRAWARSKEAQK